MARLPDFAHRFFWDVDPARLDPETYPEYVIERLLEHGDLRSVRWMLNNFPPPQIVRVSSTLVGQLADLGQFHLDRIAPDTLLGSQGRENQFMGSHQALL